MSPLLLLILIPLGAAVAVLLGAPARRTSLGAAVALLATTLWLFFAYDRTAAGFQFVSAFPVLAEVGIQFKVGCDGLNLIVLLLTALVTLAAVWVAPAIETRSREYHACLLLIATGAMGAFASLDIFFFYIFHELALIPTFLLIGFWGTGERQIAAWKITLYLSLGSIILLVGLLALYWQLPADLRSFDMVTLLDAVGAGKNVVDPAQQGWIYLLLLVGFGILVSLFPLHTWAPDAYAAAPIPAAMLHAGVLKKFGLYGLLRLAQPLLPAGAAEWSNLLLILLVGNILFVGLATLSQRSLDRTLGYSSVMHMGYIFLGVAGANILSTRGAAVLMLAHGLSIAALFAMAGEIRQRTGSLHYDDLGGLAKSTPRLGLLFGLAAFASIGLPGFANFVGEIMIFFGAFGGGAEIGGFNAIQIATTCALWGVVISAVYMLRAYRNVFMGDTANRCVGVSDISKSAHWAVLLLIAGLLVFGFFPGVLTNLFGVATDVIALK